MKILGIGGSTHDYSFCLLENGRVTRAVEEERLSRNKHATDVKSKFFTGISYCLENITIHDVDLIVSNDIVSESIQPDYDLHNIVRINHHLAHAASSYYMSGMSEAAILVLDAGGSYYGGKQETCSLGYAQHEKIEFYKKYYQSSIAGFYQIFTMICGFEYAQEGKLMGLASYGKPTYVEALKQYVDIAMPNRMKIAAMPNKLPTLSELEFCKDDRRDSFQIRADIAYAVQHVFEESLIKILNYLYEQTKLKNLCYSGGGALNSVSNGMIKKRTPFENVFVFPAAGDSGTSIGAALYAYHGLLKKPMQTKPMQSASYGKRYTKDDILTVLERAKDSIEYKIVDDTELYKLVARCISEGRIVGWFQDGSEFGPRALGFRSILADPRRKDMKDMLNSRVKFRESFRPFAPVILKNKVHNYFITDHPDTPFMMFVGQVRPDKQQAIPAVTHVDGTARLQTVNEHNNEKLYRLLKEVKKRTGIPILINTSFNIKGEPIVETPNDALQAFLNCDMDILVIDHVLIKKQKKRADNDSVDMQK